jgi:hypothetical protein
MSKSSQFLNPISQEDAYQIWFEQNPAYRSFQKAGLQNYIHTRRLNSFQLQNNMSTVNFTPSQTNFSFHTILNFLVKHAVLSAVILFLVLTSITAAASQVFLPEPYKPSTLLGITKVEKESTTNDTKQAEVKEPQKEEPKKEEPKVEDPKKEEPKREGPKREETKREEPKVSTAPAKPTTPPATSSAPYIPAAVKLEGDGCVSIVSRKDQNNPKPVCNVVDTKNGQTIASFEYGNGYYKEYQLGKRNGNIQYITATDGDAGWLYLEVRQLNLETKAISYLGKFDWGRLMGGDCQYRDPNYFTSKCFPNYSPQELSENKAKAQKFDEALQKYASKELIDQFLS